MAATTGSVTVANEDHYFATREAYQKNSDVEKRKYPFVEEVATSVMANIVKDDVNSSSSVFRVLGVGSGDGRSDLRILTAVAMTIESCQIHATIIEPDAKVPIASFLVSATPGGQSYLWMALDNVRKVRGVLFRDRSVFWPDSFYHISVLRGSWRSSELLL